MILFDVSNVRLGKYDYIKIPLLAIGIFVAVLLTVYSLVGCTASFSLQKQNENSSVTIKTESSNHADSTRVTFNN